MLPPELPVVPYQLPAGIDLALRASASATGSIPPGWSGRTSRQMRKLSSVYIRGGLTNRSVTSFSPVDHTTDTNRLLQQHFPFRHAVEQIATDPNISFMDKAQIIHGLRGANQQKTTGLLQARDVVPSLIGAGLGYVGARLTSSLLGLPPSMDRTFRAGSTILGALLNNPRIV
jgi:hypothetical protein